MDIHPLDPSRDFPRLRELCDQTDLELGLMSVNLFTTLTRRRKAYLLVGKIGYTRLGFSISDPGRLAPKQTTTCGIIEAC